MLQCVVFTFLVHFYSSIGKKRGRERKRSQGERREVKRSKQERKGKERKKREEKGKERKKKEEERKKKCTDKDFGTHSHHKLYCLKKRKEAE